MGTASGMAAPYPCENGVSSTSQDLLPQTGSYPLPHEHGPDYHCIKRKGGPLLFHLLTEKRFTACL